MYKVYVLRQRKGGSQVLTDTQTKTPLFAAATAAFWALYDEHYDNKHLLLMTKDNKQINAYRFGAQPDDADHLIKGQALNDI